MGASANISTPTGMDFIMDNDANTTNNQIRFRTNGDTVATATDIMTVDEVGGGRVGILTSAPQAALDIAGAIITRSTSLANFASASSI
jgi:hypothetical protein